MGCARSRPPVDGIVTYLVVATVALLASGLTLFSGFGLGTLLLPAFALFFPIEIAVGATAVVHLANNLFKLALIGRHADRRSVIAFGGTALIGAVIGAWLLGRLAGLPDLLQYSLGGRSFSMTWAGSAIGGLILIFAVLELAPAAERLAFPRRWLPLGGLVSGFFGGLSGHQGALRSAFLIQSGLSKEAFIGTGVACAVIVDVARLLVYSTAIVAGRSTLLQPDVAGPVVVATLAAFAGAFIGVRLLGKVTLRGIRRLVGGLLCLLGVALVLGWL